MNQLSLAECEMLDAADELADRRTSFVLPDGVIYLDGNSLGPPINSAAPRLASLVTDEWGRSLIGGWNQHGWMDLPVRLGARLAPFLGVAEHEVVVADNTTVNLFKLLHAGLDVRADRRVIVAADDEFPTDRYLVDSIAAARGCTVRRVPPAAMASALTPDVALVVSSHVHYRTAVINDVAAITDAAHAVGAVVVWDVSHSVGALPLTLGTDRVDFAVGCTYKYLNGGPGAPAFCMVAERWHQYLGTPITGWLGHRRPFDFAERFEPAEGLRRLVTGTPPVTALRALDVALDAFDPRDLPAVRRKAQVLGELFVRGVHHATGGELRQVSPADPTHRGNHVSFAHPQAYGLVQALAARGVIGDFRTPDVARFGFAPLYLRHADTFEATQRLDEVWRNREYRDPAYATRADVT